MLQEPHEILTWLIQEMDGLSPELVTKKGTESAESKGTKEVMQGKQKVDGHYFTSVVLKPKDVRWYFFPIYTHPQEFTDISEGIRKMLKGKSCFHLKKISENEAKEISSMLAKAKQIYLRDGII